MNVSIFSIMAYENLSRWPDTKTNPIKPNSNPIAERVKLMQSLYLQRIMKKYAAKGYEKTNPILPTPEGGKTQVRGRISFLCLLFPDWDQLFFAYFAFLGFFGSLGFFTFLAFGAFGTF